MPYSKLKEVIGYYSWITFCWVNKANCSRFIFSYRVVSTDNVLGRLECRMRADEGPKPRGTIVLS